MGKGYVGRGFLAVVLVWSWMVVDTQGKVGLKVASTAGLNVGL